MQQNFQNNIQQHSFKFVFIGATATGKTSLINRYAENQFLETQSTLSVALIKKDLFVQNHNIQFQIWDSAGQERFDAITPTYFRSCNAIGLVISLDQQESLNKAQWWLDQIKFTADSNVKIYLLVNKIDLKEDEIQISDELIKNFAMANILQTYYVSAKTGENVHQFINNILDDYIKDLNKIKVEIQQQLVVRGARKPKSWCCK